MNNYPLDFAEFEKEFCTEQKCLGYLHKLRWPQGYRCPRCQYDKAWRINEAKYKCQNCGYQATVTAGTIFQDTHIPLIKWFRTIWYIASQPGGTNALELKNTLGFGSYRTSWTLLHKLRTAMAFDKETQLKGTVEVGKGYLGNKDIAVAVEVKEGQVSKIRLHILTNRGLNGFIKENIVPGSRVLLYDKGYIQKGNKKVPHVVQVISDFKKWLPAVLKGYDSRQLVYYLDEYCFKFNRRGWNVGQLFYEILQNTVRSQPITYQDIVFGK